MSQHYDRIRNTDDEGSTANRKSEQKKTTSLSSDSIFSIIFSFLFKGIQSNTAYNDLISYVP